jgi:hypothetical protein
VAPVVGRPTVFRLERYDDDPPETATNQWIYVASFWHDPPDNRPGLDVANLVTNGSAFLGQVRTNNIAPQTGSVVSVAGALTASEPVRVTGPNAPASELYGGTLVVGPWRIRGNQSNALFLERLDNDGAIVSDGWVNVATFVHNPDNNVPGLDIANLGMSGSTTLGALQMLGDIAADTLRARSK